MVVGFKTTYVISDVVSSNLDQGEAYSLSHYEEKFVSDLRFYPDLPVSSTNKTHCHDIIEILLKMALNTIKQKYKQLGNCYEKKIIMTLSVFYWFPMADYI
jgi:hypothetical protein